MVLKGFFIKRKVLCQVVLMKRKKKFLEEGFWNSGDRISKILFLHINLKSTTKFWVLQKRM